MVTKGMQWIAVAVLGLSLTACPKKDETKPRPPPPLNDHARPITGPRHVGPGPSPHGPRRPARLTAVQVVDKAIAAAGGLAALKAKLSAYTMETKGKYMGMPYTATTHRKASVGHLMSIPGMKTDWGTSPTDCWHRLRGIVLPCPKGYGGEMRLSQLVGDMLYLWLLKEPDVKLERIVRVAVGGDKQVAIRVTRGKVNATVVFRKKGWRILGVTWMGAFGPKHETGALHMAAVAHMTQGGVTFASKYKLTFNGKPVLIEEIVSIKLGTVDAARLKRPAQLAFGAPQTQKAPAYHAVWSKFKAKNADLPKVIPEKMKKLYGWLNKRGIRPLPSAPTVHFLKAGRKKSTIEIRVAVVKPTVTPTGLKTYKLKDVPAQTLMWALHQGPHATSLKWLKALKKTLKKIGKKIAGPGGMQPMSDSTKVTDKTKLLNVVFYPVR